MHQTTDATDNPTPPLKQQEQPPTTPAGKHGGGKRQFTSEEEEVKGFCARYGVQRVRGCEVYEVRDQGGNVLNDPAAAARQQVNIIYI